MPAGASVHAGTRSGRRLLTLLALVVVLASACVGPAPSGPRIALLLPETKTARYETQDRPAFEGRLAEVCPDCVAMVHNAGHDAARQQAQAEAALTNGASVLVLDPVDAVSAGVIARHAAASGVPVITYDRILFDAPVTFHITFDNERVGMLQAQSLVDAVGDTLADGWIVVLNGAATDANAAEFRRGANLVFESQEIRIGAETDVPDWSPELAQESMERAIATLGRDAIVGVYSANDAMAGGAIAAMRSAGLSPIPPTTGQDAELAALRRIISGDQHMTVYKSFRTQARMAAEVAYVLSRDGELPAGVATSHTDNGDGPVPTLRLTPLAVTRDTIARTVVADGMWTVQELCDGLAADCARIGLTG